MPANTKPVPWNEIRRRYEAGEAENAIAEDLTANGMKISKQGIRKRRQKEGWKVNPSAVKVRQAAEAWQQSGLVDTATARQLTTGASRGSTQLVNWGCRTPENAQKILGHVSLTGDIRLAARSVGIHPDTLKRWRDDDPDFAALLDAANAEFCLSRVQDIAKASERGDWKAGDRLLQTNDLTRETYAIAQEN